jgi:uncharacterized membrane protein YbhN (UPF0104 family)
MQGQPAGLAGQGGAELAGTARRSGEAKTRSVMTYDPHKSDVEIRQGSRRKMNARVLFISLGALVILFLIIYFAFFAASPPPATA